MSIGQGEIGLTPLQMANVAAIIANKGFYYTPHVVRSIGDQHYLPPVYKIKHYTLISRMHFDTIIAGMAGVCVAGGTASQTGIPGIQICGKTGTAQNPHGEDHSIFIAFAPRNNPKIAICVIVENGGFGNAYAAPIANLLIERYLATDRTLPSAKPEMLKRMLDANLTREAIQTRDTIPQKP